MARPFFYSLVGAYCNTPLPMAPMQKLMASETWQVFFLVFSQKVALVFSQTLKRTCQVLKTRRKGSTPENLTSTSSVIAIPCRGRSNPCPTIFLLFFIAGDGAVRLFVSCFPIPPHIKKIQIGRGEPAQFHILFFLLEFSVTVGNVKVQRGSRIIRYKCKICILHASFPIRLES